jgi:alpha-galactosidase|tara:strand:- start:1901 stop:3187 length:1287 start_codon:yes stop_codon:yes gene_type:complete
LTKISLIGAGSVVFARRLLQDIVCVPELSDSTVSLMDTDSERLGLMSKFANKLVRDTGTNINVETTTERREALHGSDYVLTTIRVGDSYERDIGIPLKYGVDQSVGDTIGPGGVFKALRTAPVLIDICEDIADVAPDANLLNYTNPMAIACWAIAEATDVPTIGLCHSVQHTTADLANYVGVSKERVKGWVAGINHLAWFLRFEVDGQDAYPKLIEAMQNPDIFSQDTVRFEVMKQFGYFVTESTRHMSEYTPYFRTNEQTIEDFNLDQIRQDLQRRTIRVDDHYGQLLEDANTDRRLTAERSDEYACQIIEAMESDRPIVINGNVPNEGLIDNLLNLSSVEVPILIDKLGFHPMAVGELPGQLAALSRSNQAVQQMAVNAILDGDKEAAFHAIALDPLTSAVLSLGEIREMFDEMWSAHGAELASYS